MLMDVCWSTAAAAAEHRLHLGFHQFVINDNCLIKYVYIRNKAWDKTVWENTHLPMYVPAEASREALYMKRQATLVSEALQKSLWAFIIFFPVTACQHHHVALPSVTVILSIRAFQTSSLNVQRKSARPVKTSQISNTPGYHGEKQTCSWEQMVARQ